MHCNRHGMSVAACWDEIPDHYPNVVLDAFAIMPNHLHAILILTETVGAGHARPIPTIIGSFKSAVSRSIGTNIWQRSYWERILRDEKELNRFRHYVDDNHLRWRTSDL